MLVGADLAVCETFVPIRCLKDEESDNMPKLTLRAMGAALWPNFLAKKTSSLNQITYEVHGSGPVVILGYPIMLGPEGNPLLLERYVDGLTDRYCVVVMHYPPTGSDAELIADCFTPDRVCADILGVADRAGIRTFAWFGYSWGGLVGLQLSCRTDRLTALICGGFSPLGIPYKAIVAAMQARADRNSKLYKPMMTFFRALELSHNPDALPNCSCPRMTFAGNDDVILGRGTPAIPIGPLIAQHRTQLQEMNWKVQLLPGYRHDLFMHVDVVIPLIRSFLDPILLVA